MKVIFKIFRKNIFKLRLIIANQYNRPYLFSKHFDIKMGKNVRIVDPNVDFGSEPYLVEIGDNVTISTNVNFVTHDGGVGLFRNEFPNIEKMNRIIIGNNVFIGMNVTICPGVKIGNNVVVGIGSVVTKNIPDNVVFAGVPAKFIKTIEQYKYDCLNKAIYIKNKGSENMARKDEILKNLKIYPHK